MESPNSGIACQGFKGLKQKTPAPAAKSKPIKEIPIQTPKAVSGIDSKEEDAKITKSK